VGRFVEGDKKMTGFFVGAVMKATGGNANGKASPQSWPASPPPDRREPPVSGSPGSGPYALAMTSNNAEHAGPGERPGMKPRSFEVTDGPAKAPARAMLRAVG